MFQAEGWNLLFVTSRQRSKAEDIFVEINGNDIRQFHAKITNKDGNPIEVAIKNE